MISHLCRSKTSFLYNMTVSIWQIPSVELEWCHCCTNSNIWAKANLNFLFIHCKCFDCRKRRCLSVFKIQIQSWVISTVICLWSMVTRVVKFSTAPPLVSKIFALQLTLVKWNFDILWYEVAPGLRSWTNKKPAIP